VSDLARNNIHPNSKQKPEITIKNTGKKYVNMASHAECESCFQANAFDLHLHFQVLMLWLTPLL